MKFKIGDIAKHKLTGDKVLIIGIDNSLYEVRLQNYETIKINEIELEKTERKVVHKFFNTQWPVG